MTPSTDELTRSADRSVETSSSVAPCPHLTCPCCGSEAAVSRGPLARPRPRSRPVVMLFVATGGLLVSGLPSTTPANSGAPTYPEVVSDQFVQDLRVESRPIFGLVAAAPRDSRPDDTLVIERDETLATLKTAAWSNGGYLGLDYRRPGPGTGRQMRMDQRGPSSTSTTDS